MVTPADVEISQSLMQLLHSSAEAPQEIGSRLQLQKGQTLQQKNQPCRQFHILLSVSAETQTTCPSCRLCDSHTHAITHVLAITAVYNGAGQGLDFSSWHLVCAASLLLRQHGCLDIAAAAHHGILHGSSEDLDAPYTSQLACALHLDFGIMLRSH